MLRAIANECNSPFFYVYTKRKKMSFLTRREFIKISALSAGLLVISTGLSGCGEEDIKDVLSDAANVSFNHGIASGDPLADKVIIWTRVTTTAASVDVNYEVATDAKFTTIIHNGTVVASAAHDYTVKIDVQNLDAGTFYYYRFKSNGVTSLTGKMKTLPTGDVSQVKMVIFSCANYPNGFFNAYTEASKIEDLDVTLHLGDYIYEYGMYENDDFTAKVPAYATSNAVAMGRVLPSDNNTECLLLADYRKRYATYHLDSGLQAIHAACPMIVVWDDHEIANDTYESGAQNHDESEGSFSDRVSAALQAYFEWLPIRPVDNKKEIYRTFNFGDLLSLNMLETRVFGRDIQLSYANYFQADGSFLQDKYFADFTDSSRTMLGSEQLTWLQGQFAASTATWQVLGQQVVMGRMNLPSELLIGISQLDYVSDEQRGALLLQINTSLSELATIKYRILVGDPSVTDAEKARVQTELPYNLDAWDGYFVERETIFGTAKAYGKNLVVLSGDTHNAWANNLKDMSGNSVGVEFATTSVTSPGMEEYLGIASLEQSTQLEGAIQLLVNDLQYCNLMDRGFAEVIFTKDEAVSNWHYVTNYDSPTYTMNSSRKYSTKTTTGTNTLEMIVGTAI